MSNRIQDVLARFHLSAALERVLPTTHGHDFDPDRFARQRHMDGNEPHGESASESDAGGDDLNAWARDC